MSHDEVNHVVPSFDLFTGRATGTTWPRMDPSISFNGFVLLPFGDNDFTSRLPHAIFSIATVWFVMVFFRRYLGKYGAIAAGLLFAISPFMLFYGRYARNDALCAFFSVAAIYAVLRYLESGGAKYLMLFTVMLSLNFAAKETAYIFTALLMVFVFILTIFDFFKAANTDPKTRSQFLLNNLLVIDQSFCLSPYRSFAKNSAARLATGELNPLPQQA